MDRAKFLEPQLILGVVNLFYALLVKKEMFTHLLVLIKCNEAIFLRFLHMGMI